MQMRVDMKVLEKTAFVMHVFVAIVLFAVVIHRNYPELMTHAAYESEIFADAYTSTCLLSELNACTAL
jgi:hypothetical protein